MLQCFTLIGGFEHDDNHIVYSNLIAFLCFCAEYWGKKYMEASRLVVVDPGIYFFTLVRTLDKLAPDEV
jgi:hypothetical protein